MKKVIVGAAAAALLATASFAGQIGSGGVKSIKDNGRINGNQSWTISCNSGWGVVTRKGNSWANDTGSTYSDRLWGLSLEDFAKKMCE